MNTTYALQNYRSLQWTGEHKERVERKIKVVRVLGLFEIIWSGIIFILVMGVFGLFIICLTVVLYLIGTGIRWGYKE